MDKYKVELLGLRKLLKQSMEDLPEEYAEDVNDVIKDLDKELGLIKEGDTDNG